MGYHDDFTSVSKTMLSLFLHSRQEYYLTYVTREMAPKRVGKPALVGHVLHSVFEGAELEDVVRLYPDAVLKCNGDLDGKKAAALRADRPGVQFVKEAEYDAIQATIAGVLQHRELAALLTVEGKREARIDASVNGTICKCKPDLLCDLGDTLVCYDFKFMEDVSPGAWYRSSRRFTYWLQDAHYTEVIESTFRKPVTFRFACVETEFPYRVIWRYFDPQSRERCREKHSQILDDLARCHKSGDWSDDWESVCVVEPWQLDLELSDEVLI